ncbi:MAG: glycosyltransferase [Lachnospiraceae bacterium]|nr:glycosyltransferase [Lachnospiraceae bacterium]
MKKILYVLNTGVYSGAENVTLQIINNLDKTKYKGIYTSLDGEIRGRVEQSGIQFEPLAKLNARNLRKVIKRVNPDIIHANDYTAACVSVAAFPHVPVIAHLHNNSKWIQKLNIRSVLFGLCAPRCEKILVVSDAIVREYIFKSVITKKAECIGNPIDIKKIQSIHPHQEKKEYDIIVLGRLSEAKDPIRALRIIKQVSSDRDIRTIFVGDGELRGLVESYIEENNMSDIVELAGFQKNPYEYISKSKALLMPSAWEGFGLAAVEGLAYGIPVVSSAAGGLPEIVDESCGRVCTTDEQFIDEIIRLLSDEEYYISKCNGARSRAEILDNSERYFRRINKIYEEL